MESGNEIWSVNRTKREKYFSQKLYRNQGGETNSSPLLCFKKALYGVNGGGLHLSFNIFL